ncbi:MAG: ABC transporter permease [Mobilitalea sp.]
MRNKIKIFFQQAWLYYKGSNAQFNIEELIFYRISIPLITLVYYCVIARTSFRTEYLTQWVIGNSLLLCNNTCVFVLGGSFEGERHFGRLKWLIASPHSRIATVFEKGFFFIFESFVTVLMGIVFGSLIFGVDFTNVNLFLFLIIILIGVFAAVGFGIFISVFSLLGNSLNLLLNLISMSMAILCGANFPVKDLPQFAQFISYCLPFTRSIEASKMLFGNMDLNRFRTLLAGEMGVGFVFLIISALFFKTIEKIAIKKASLEIF